MKKFLVFFSILIFSNSLFSQDFVKVDKVVENYPKTISNTEELANLIQNDFNRTDEKVRAVFSWIAKNISYDVVGSHNMGNKSSTVFKFSNEKEKLKKELLFKTQTIAKVLNTKSGVCNDYSIVFEDLCNKLKIENKIIVGHLKSDASQIGNENLESNHSWNAVKIENEWKFVDVTLAAGFVSSKTNAFKFDFNQSYFFTTPEYFFLNHFPEDKKWLLGNFLKIDFVKLPLFYGEYLKGNYKIVNYKEGILSTANKSELLLRFDKPISSEDQINYYFHSDRKLEYFKNENPSDEFKISIAGRKNEYLSVFLNKKVIATYRIL